MRNDPDPTLHPDPTVHPDPTLHPDPTVHPALRAIDAFVPERLRAADPSLLRDARMVVGGALLATAAQLWTTVSQALNGTPAFAVAAGLGMLAMGAVPLGLRATGRVRPAAHAVVAILFAAGATTMVLSGGHGVVPLFYVGFAPLGAVMLLGRRAGAAWLAVCVVFVAGLAWAVFDGHLAPPVHPEPRAVHISTVRGTALLAFIGFGIALVYESLKDRALREVVAAQDRAEREHAARLQEESRFRALIERSRAALLIVGPDGRPAYRSPAAQALRGFPAGSLPADRRIFEAVHPDDREDIADRFRLCLRSPGEPVAFRCRLSTAQGGWIVAEGDALNLIDDPAVGGVVVSYRDVTSRVEAEAEHERLRQRVQEDERLKSLGVLAGGIAHDFNNLLVTIQGNAQLVLAEEEVGPAGREMLQDVEDAAKRAADLTQQLLAYAGKGRVEPETVRLSDLAGEVARLVRRRLPEGATLEVEDADDPSWVHADVGQVHQVVMNLVVNAVESLGSDGGRILVRTGVRKLDGADRARCRLPDASVDGPHAFVEIEDTGCGMSPETLERIFDPFFTTKFRGRGLGLAALLGIVRGHGGNLWVESEPGRGSTFCVLLPHAAPPAPAQPGKAAAADAGSGVLVVVDDEPGVRQVTARILSRAGFEVVACGSGPEALERVARCDGGVTAVVLDLEMPGMDGQATFQELRLRWPDLPVLFMSGHGEADLAGRLGDASRVAFVSKPFGAAELSERLEALRKAPPGARGTA